MFEVMFIIIPILVLLVFIFTFAMIFSPKLRGKMMANQIKAGKYMIEQTKEDIKSISDDMEYATHDATHNSTVNIASSIKEGLTKGDVMHCKYCNALIDKDSKYCKECGK